MRYVTLSRRSLLYRHTFGENGYKVHGFPNPTCDTIPMGLYFILTLALAMIRTYARIMMSAVSACLVVLAFLLDGSIVRGNVWKQVSFTPIEPWPRIAGHRIPPWVILYFALLVGYALFMETGTALEYTVYTTAIVALSWLVLHQEGPSLSEQMAEAAEPAVDGWLQQIYKKPAWLLPTIQLVD